MIHLRVIILLRCCRKEQKEQEKQEKDLAIAPISEDTVATVLATPDDEVRCRTHRISVMCRGHSMYASDKEYVFFFLADPCGLPWAMLYS